MSEQAELFFQQLKSAVETDQLKLPTLPDVALSIRKAVDNEHHSAQQIADIISHDPSLAARLLQLANSPLYRCRGEIDNLQTAVTRLGVRIVRDLVTTLALRQMFETDSPVLDQHFRELWTCSVKIAAICRMLASELEHLDTEQALLAGLIHNIGALPIIVLAERDPALIDDRQRLHQLTLQLQNSVGEMILKFWRFPESLIRVVGEFSDVDVSKREADYVDLVRIALLYNALETSASEPDQDQRMNQALEHLGIRHDSKLLSMDERRHSIDATVQSLMVL
jgi:HD-like signal output (HDOD) protein